MSANSSTVQFDGTQTRPLFPQVHSFLLNSGTLHIAFLFRGEIERARIQPYSAFKRFPAARRFHRDAQERKLMMSVRSNSFTMILPNNLLNLANF